MRRTSLLWVFFARALGVVCLIGLVVTPNALAGPNDDTDAVLARLAAQAQKVQTIQSPFVQRKRLAAFNAVLVTKGRFAFRRPGDLLWEYLEPSRSGFVLRGEQGWQWDASTGQHKSFTVASSPEMEAVAGQIVAWATFDLKWLRSRYQITLVSSVPLVLKLVPTGQGIRKFLDYLLVQFQPSGDAVRTIELREIDGDWTRISFTAPRLNDPLDESIFVAPK